MFSFKVILALLRYHAYKETSWSNAKLNNEVKMKLGMYPKSLSTDPYVCATKARHFYFVSWKTVGYISQENYVYFLLKNSMKRFWNSKVFEIQAITDFFWKIKRSFH